MSKAERRLNHDLSTTTVSKISVHTEGPVGERVYLVELWGWKFLFRPSIDYPFKAPTTSYLRPDTDTWHNTFFETTAAQLTLEQLAMSVICDLH